MATSAPVSDIHRQRLFVGSCVALIATSVAFAVVAAVAGTLKEKFLLSNAQVGQILGAGLWGFPISIFILGSLCDVIGMKRLMTFAFICHIVAVLLMIFAKNFGMLFAGALIIAIGNGTVEAVCNPLVATLYPDRKTEKLNQFHVWFPGGITIGAVLAFFLAKMNLGPMTWQITLGLVLIPTVIYGYMMLTQKFPPTEAHASGVSFPELFKHTFTRPLFWLLMFCMAITASTELAPNRWVPAILEAGGIHGILVLAYINLLMAILRFYAGHTLHRLSPVGILAMSALLAAIGLFMLSKVETTAAAFVAATIFAVGVCYVWPTMLGMTSERIPKGGAMALSVLSGFGMLVVGIYTTPKVGSVADSYLYEKMDMVKAESVLQEVVDTYPTRAAEIGEKDKDVSADIMKSVEIAQNALAAPKDDQSAHAIVVANALRSAIDNGGGTDTVGDARAVLNPAENYGGRMAFQKIVPFTALVFLIFAAMFVMQRMSGGYKVERIGEGA